MFIVWGKKRVEKKIGFAADFCPICRSVSQFQIFRVGMAGHIYYLSVGEGELVGHVGKCQQCGTVLNVDATIYKGYEKRAEPSLERLIENTFPDVREVYAKRLEAEEKIQRRATTFTPQERETLILEPFQLFARQVEARYAATQFDKESGMGCLGTILLPAIFFIVGSTMIKHAGTQDSVLMAAGVVFAVGLVYTLVQLALGPGRYNRREIIPKMARALKPLDPTKDELARCLDGLKAGGFQIGKKLRIEALWAALQSQSLAR